MTSESPLATGYAAPLHGHGATGFILTGIISIVVVVAGLTGSVPFVLFGLGGLLASAIGLYLYWSTVRTKPAVQVYADRVEFLRGHRTGVVWYSDITNVRAMQWGGSLYPYTRATRFIILETQDGEWQFGPEVANCKDVQEAVVRALNAATGVPPTLTPPNSAPSES
jgi:hypothetical protein